MPFHERQSGSLCAQHALNSLLQGPFFSPMDLAELARGLDEAERGQMAEGGVEGADYLRYIAEGSSNYDDSGFFSSQVISTALEIWGITITPITHESMAETRSDPLREAAFICWLSAHWFTIRKVGNRWWNLDSMQAEPAVVSETYLTMLLHQLQSEKYTVFVCRGRIPEHAVESFESGSTKKFRDRLDGSGGSAGKSEAEMLAAAISASLSEMKPAHESACEAGSAMVHRIDTDEDTNNDDVAKAIALSLTGSAGSATAEPSLKCSNEASHVEVSSDVTGPLSSQLSKEELRAKRLARFSTDNYGSRQVAKTD